MLYFENSSITTFPLLVVPDPEIITAAIDTSDPNTGKVDGSNNFIL